MCFKKEDGGRHTPFFTNTDHSFILEQTDVNW